MPSQQNNLEMSQDVKEKSIIEEITIDTILDKIGSFGLFQRVLFVFFILCVLIWGCLNDASVLFMMAEPPWQCREVRELFVNFLKRNLILFLLIKDFVV